MYGEKDAEEKKLKTYTQSCCLCAYVKKPGCKPMDCCLEAFGIRKYSENGNRSFQTPVLPPHEFRLQSFGEAKRLTGAVIFA